MARSPMPKGGELAVLDLITPEGAFFLLAVLSLFFIIIMWKQKGLVLELFN